jgi:hypothetical protein
LKSGWLFVNERSNTWPALLVRLRLDQLAMFKYESMGDPAGDAQAERVAVRMGRFPAPTDLEIIGTDTKQASSQHFIPSGYDRAISSTFLSVSGKKGNAASQKNTVDNTITIKCNYDFSRVRACSPGITRRCVKDFVIFKKDGKSKWETKILTIPAPSGATEFINGITATIPAKNLKPGTYSLGVAAFGANGRQSESKAKVWIQKHWWQILIL